MPLALVVTSGYGNGTFTGSIANVVVRGYLTLSKPPARRIITESKRRQTIIISKSNRGITIS